MKPSITNCNSNDQLLQLVSIQLLQKAYFRRFMFEGSNYFSVFLLSLSWRTEALTQGSSSVQCTAAEYWQQKLVASPQCAAVPLMAQDVISAPASQAFVERLQFVVC